MLSEKFPDVMKIELKDPRGVKKNALQRKIKDQYTNLRLKISSASKGRIRYYPYQLDYFFLKENRIDGYQKLFSSGSACKEIFSDSQLADVIPSIKQKQYLLNVFQRIMFLQQFYARYNSL